MFMLHFIFLPHVPSWKTNIHITFTCTLIFHFPRMTIFQIWYRSRKQSENVSQICYYGSLWTCKTLPNSTQASIMPLCPALPVHLPKELKHWSFISQRGWCVYPGNYSSQSAVSSALAVCTVNSSWPTDLPSFLLLSNRLQGTQRCVDTVGMLRTGSQLCAQVPSFFLCIFYLVARKISHSVPSVDRHCFPGLVPLKNVMDVRTDQQAIVTYIIR